MQRDALCAPGTGLLDIHSVSSLLRNSEFTTEEAPQLEQTHTHTHNLTLPRKTLPLPNTEISHCEVFDALIKSSQ